MILLRDTRLLWGWQYVRLIIPFFFLLINNTMAKGSGLSKLTNKSDNEEMGEIDLHNLEGARKIKGDELRKEEQTSLFLPSCHVCSSTADYPLNVCGL